MRLLLASAALAVLVSWGAVVLFGMPVFSRAAAATPTVFMSPSGSGTACTQSAPCSSVPAAYAVAASEGGATVQMAAGSYTTTQFPGNQGNSSGMVVFQPAPGASVSWGEFRPYGASNIKIDNVTLGAYLNATNGSSGSPASNLIFRNDKITGADLYIRSANHVSFLGGDVCCDNTGIPTPTVGNGGIVPASNRVHDILFDGVSFHDISRQLNPSEHDECLFVQGADHVTVKNSTFTNCSIMDIYLHAINGEANPTDVHLLNNTFGRMGPLSVDTGYYTVLFRADAGETINGFDVEGNSLVQPLFIENDPAASVSGLVRCGNIGSFSSLSPVTWADCSSQPPPTTTTPSTTSTTTPTSTTTTTTTPSGSGLVGDQALEASSDIISSGTAEAYSYPASRSGSLDTANVYVRPRTTATRVAVGLYAATGGHPGALLASCSFTPSAGTWDSCAATARVTSQSTYWIALLPTGGKLWYAAGLSEASETNAGRHLRSLPATWTTGGSYTHGPASAFFDSTAPVP